jgi:hypothetical protein
MLAPAIAATWHIIILIYVLNEPMGALKSKDGFSTEKGCKEAIEELIKLSKPAKEGHRWELFCKKEEE